MLKGIEIRYAGLLSLQHNALAYINTFIIKLIFISAHFARTSRLKQFIIIVCCT